MCVHFSPYQLRQHDLLRVGSIDLGSAPPPEDKLGLATAALYAQGGSGGHHIYVGTGTKEGHLVKVGVEGQCPLGSAGR